MLAPPNNSMELSSGFAVAQPDSAPLRPTAARRSRRLLRPWGVQLISRPLERLLTIQLVTEGALVRREPWTSTYRLLRRTWLSTDWR
jgi:hypothetical protein